MREITCGGRRRFSSRDAAAALLARHLYTDRPADGRRVGCFWRTAAVPPDPRLRVLREYARLALLARSGGGLPLAFGFRG